MQQHTPIRKWLIEHGYDDVANLITEIESEWKAQGKATRRNWWKILAGDKLGKPRHVAGRTFPVIAAVRKRHHLPPAKDSQSRKHREKAPKIRVTGRWPSAKT